MYYVLFLIHAVFFCLWQGNSLARQFFGKVVASFVALLVEAVSAGGQGPGKLPAGILQAQLVMSTHTDTGASAETLSFYNRDVGPSQHPHLTDKPRGARSLENKEGGGACFRLLSIEVYEISRVTIVV